jgi:magnesium transporter
MIENLENPSHDMIQERVKRDPAIGSSVLLTAVTNSMGCFVFLGLATVLLP